MKYDNTNSGAAFPSKDKNEELRAQLIEHGIYSGVFQVGKKEKTKRQLFARMKGKGKQVVVIDKDGTTEIYRSKLKKNKERGEKGPHFYAMFDDIKIAVFKKQRSNGDVYWQFVPALVGADLGTRPADITTIV